MGSAGRLLVLTAAVLTLCAAEDLCDSVQCDQPGKPLCAQSSEDESLALFPDLCVLRCTNCRLRAAGVGVEYTLLNDTVSCENGAVVISECPEEINSKDDSKLIKDISILEMEADNDDDDDDGDVLSFADDGLPIALMSSFPGDLLGRLLGSAMSMPSPPQAHDGSLTIVDADVKVSVNININPTPRPGPPPPPPPPIPVKLGLEEMRPPPPPETLLYMVPEEDVYSSSPSGPRADVALVAAVSVLVAASLHI